MMPYDLMLVDGYNVVNQWRMAGTFVPGELDYLREQLINMLSSFAGYWEIPCVVVFDAHHVRGGLQVEQCINAWVTVVYTAEGHSADNWIERYSNELSNSDRKVVVVSSDWTEQTVILSHGSHRMSARELLSRVRQTKELIDSKFMRYPLTAQRSWLADSLPSGVRVILDKMRLNETKPEKRQGQDVKWGKRE